MLQIETDSSKPNFADIIGKEEESDSDQCFGLEEENKAKFTIETLIAFPSVPIEKRCKNISALLDIGATESLLAEMVKGNQSSMSKMPKIT